MDRGRLIFRVFYSFGKLAGFLGIVSFTFPALRQIFAYFVLFLFLRVKNQNFLILFFLGDGSWFRCWLLFCATLRVLILPIKESMLESVNDRLELLHTLVVRLQQILNWLWLFFPESQSLKSRVKLLDRGIFEIS